MSKNKRGYFPNIKIEFFFLLITLMHLVQTGYSQIQKGQDLFGEANGDYSGYSVSMPNGTTIAIGANRNEGSAFQSGHARVYSWNGSTWEQKGGDLDGESYGDRFGSSVSMPDSNTVAIGAVFNSDSGRYSGHVRVFSWNGSTWVQKGTDIDGENASDQSGYSVTMPEPNTLAIGATGNDGAGANSGHVRVFSWNGSKWVQKGADIDGEAAGDLSGASVSMPDENTIAIGAPSNDGGGNASGHVRVFNWNGASWSQKGSDIDGMAAGDGTGNSVSMPDANTVAIGASISDVPEFNIGKVRVFTWDGASWNQKGKDLVGEKRGDEFGHSVSMPDMNTLAVGAYKNDSNGTDAGKVYVYSWLGSKWALKNKAIYGENTRDWAGHSVSMPDNNTIAVGAHLNDNYEPEAGQVRIYEFDTALTSNNIKSTKIDKVPRVYPNPTTGNVIIDEIESEYTKIELVDLYGRIIMYMEKITQPNVQIILDDPPGVYIIRLYGEDKFLNFRLVKN